jgi:NAD(P)-dependent dehydrogenase (short-subunit alcohol dehydrogenase family)
MVVTKIQNDSMKGKRVIVTGPTSGYGKKIATQLASLGAELILACRNIERGEQVADEITRVTCAENCVVMSIDTSNQQSIHEFARQYRKKYSRLDVLINNAGIYKPQRQTSVDGIELTFATNVLGYYLLTLNMLEILRANAPARIVNVASNYASDLDLSDLQFDRRAYEGLKAYAQSKACDRMLTWAVARRLEGSRVTANAMAPGLSIGTSLLRDAPFSVRLKMRIGSLLLGRSIAQGADTAIWLASSSDVEVINGRFFDQRQEKPCEFRNEENEEKLWSICEGLIKSEI